MIQLNHINLPVTNVATAVSFFERHFDFRPVEIKGDDALAVMSGAGNFILVLMKAKAAQPYPKAFHIGFLQPDAASVDQVYEQLKRGYDEQIEAPGRIRDTYGFYFTFDSILIEISCAQPV